MAESQILLLIGLMALVTAVPRVMPVALLGGRALPPAFETWLKYVPVAVLSALLVPELLLRNNAVQLSFSNLQLWVAVPTFLVAVWRRSLFLTALFGMGLLALSRLVFST